MDRSSLQCLRRKEKGSHQLKLPSHITGHNSCQPKVAWEQILLLLWRAAGLLGQALQKTNSASTRYNTILRGELSPGKESTHAVSIIQLLRFQEYSFFSSSYISSFVQSSNQMLYSNSWSAVDKDLLIKGDTSGTVPAEAGTRSLSYAVRVKKQFMN